MSFFTRVIASLMLLASATVAIAADQSLRSEVGKPLQAAKDLLQQQKYRDALGKVDEAAAISKLTPYERFIIDRMRGAAAGGAGDTATALKSFDSALASGLMTKADELPTLEIMIGLAYSGKNYTKAADTLRKYRQDGGNNPAVLALLPQVLYLSNRFADAAKELSAQLAAQEAAGKAPTEEQLQLLASCAIKQNDTAGYVVALTKLVIHHPKTSYWNDLIARTATKSGFSNKLALDTYRLRVETGTISSAADYVDAIELSLQAGYPGEAQQFLDQGNKVGVLGKGAARDLDRQARLKAMVARKIAEDKTSLAASETQAGQQPSGDGLVNTGLAYAGYGQFDKALTLIQKGIAKGKLKDVDESRLHLAYVQIRAGKKDEALKTLSQVKGKNGTADLARLWQIKLGGR
ncbi:MAG: tetratricopeptide repeat protein [Pseudomonadota bacterium]